MQIVLTGYAERGGTVIVEISITVRFTAKKNALGDGTCKIKIPRARRRKIFHLSRILYPTETQIRRWTAGSCACHVPLSVSLEMRPHFYKRSTDQSHPSSFATALPSCPFLKSIPQKLMYAFICRKDMIYGTFCWKTKKTIIFKNILNAWIPFAHKKVTRLVTNMVVNT